jgi:DNA mismatch repair protein MutS2
VPHELDLRGMTGQEGWEHLDKLIDRAIPTGLSTLNVIHGFGTGRLRDYLYIQLKRDSRVANYREAAPGQGGGGATLVSLVG